ncbi:hypothetical protein HCK00_24080 [Streptomyces sp. PLAI1-29]|uniref:Glycosyl hydrolase n=1 Tax=Streptomyces zingiberis TaxID=2053010 RepID=A0ABX1C746_9ACTN|nr:hypothetical protein [Streptomyces zingiberis]
MPGAALGAEPLPGGGVVRFARSSLLVRVTVDGAVRCAWDGAGPPPVGAPEGGRPAADARAELEPDTDGGWRVVAERVTVTVSRYGAVEFRTPGGVVLRRDLPPRWWDALDPADGGSRWSVLSQVAADARFHGPAGRAAWPRLGDGTYRLGGGPATAHSGGRLPPAVPVQLVVAPAGAHLVRHDNPGGGRMRLRQGVEGAGSGHDRPGTSELRLDGGPLCFWAVVGSPARVLRSWAALPRDTGRTEPAGPGSGAGLHAPGHAARSGSPAGR